MLLTKQREDGCMAHPSYWERSRDWSSSRAWNLWLVAGGREEMSTLHVHTVIVRAVDISMKASDLTCNSVCDIGIYMLCMKLCVKYIK